MPTLERTGTGKRSKRRTLGRSENGNKSKEPKATVARVEKGKVGRKGEQAGRTEKYKTAKKVKIEREKQTIREPTKLQGTDGI